MKKEQKPMLQFSRGLPRPVELAIAVIGLIAAMPWLMAAALAVLLIDGLPILFRQQRVGYKGQLFELYKMRTMRSHSSGPMVTAANDLRVTRIGKILRKSKLDEVPSLWNVIKGDLSLVGPRPEVPVYVHMNDPNWQLVLQVKPGITDPVTIELRNEEALLAQVKSEAERFYIDDLQRYKLQRYSKYQAARSWWTDIKVLAKTAAIVVFPFRSKAKEVERRVRMRYLTRRTQFAVDTITLACALILSYALRFDFNIPPKEINHLLMQLQLVVVIQLVALRLASVHTFIWRYVGMSEIGGFVRAGLYSALPLVVMRIFLSDQYQSFRIPLSVIVVDTALAFGGSLGLRVARRVSFERHQKRKNVSALLSTQKGKAVLLIGAGRAGVLAAREIQNSGNVELIIRGFVDDDPAKRGAMISGVKVLGTTDDLPRLIAELRIDHVVISIAQAARGDFRRILDICHAIPVKARTIPGLYEILMGNVKTSRIRDLQIEDVLGRTQVKMDEQPLVEFLTGKTVMVTGAGGSIGSELARQIARFRPTNLVLVDRAEFGLFNIDLDLREAHPEMKIVSLIADICDETRLRSILKAQRPQVILHAAAHKHVPMMESNPCEAAKNNILGTKLIGELAGEYGVDVFVLISSDKAVKPRSVMGATKRTAELIVQDLNCRCSTRYMAVRFGNVIDSAGSVIPIFRNQILKGGPVTVTHKDMKRYFMTIPEAAQLVLQAGAMGKGGEIFILDMGQPVRILDLAREIIKLSGLRPHEDIDIVFTGLRAGEKLFEELDSAEERVVKTKHPKILIGKIAPCPGERVQHAVSKIALLARNGLDRELCSLLNELLAGANLETVGEQFEVAHDLQQRIA